MKRCPECLRNYKDETLNFCLEDGSRLAELTSPNSLRDSEPPTAILNSPAFVSDAPTIVSDPGQDLASLASISKPANSIAILPLAHRADDTDDEYFCDGLAEELINSLARVEGLRVVARTSAFSFKGKNIEVSQIGSILNVEHIVEGSVRKFGDRMRINIQLVSTCLMVIIFGPRSSTRVLATSSTFRMR